MTNEDIAIMLTKHKEEIGSLKHRMDAAEARYEVLQQLAKSVDRLTVTMEHMAKEQDEQGERLKRIEQAPAEEAKYYKRQLIGYVITGLVGAILGAVYSLIFGG